MPLHDWTRVGDWVYHEVHTGWLVYLRDALNAGLLPPGYRAHAERRSAVMVPDILTLTPAPPPAAPRGPAAVAEPQTARQLSLGPATRPGRLPGRAGYSPSGMPTTAGWWR